MMQTNQGQRYRGALGQSSVGVTGDASGSSLINETIMEEGEETKPLQGKNYELKTPQNCHF